MGTLRAFFAGRRSLFALWMALCAVTLLATLRLSVFMFDPSQTSYAMVPGDEVLTTHSCLSAYIAAADRFGHDALSLYRPDAYDHDADDAQRRIHLGAFKQDTYEYPPTFLLLPKALLLFTRDFAALRALWFVLTSAFVIGGMIVAARWIGGRLGLATGLLIPFVWGSITNLLLAEQLGNVQFVIVVMAVLALIAFDERRPVLGGALLAFAIGAKLFPGALLVLILLQRRWRDAAFTAAFGAVYCLLVVAIAGVAPFREFLFFQVPRLLDGEAFAFFKSSVEIKAANCSFFGLPYKLELVGLVKDPDRLAPLLNRAFELALVLVVIAAAKLGPTAAPAATSEARARRICVWLVLLNLATTAAPLAPLYTLLGSLWLLTVWAPLGRGALRTRLLFAAAWIGLTLFIPKPAALMLACSFTAPAVNLITNGAILLTVLRRERAAGHVLIAAPERAQPS